MNDHRRVAKRGRYLAQTTDLRPPEGMAVAYTELGFSFNGIAKNIDTTETTVRGYIERAMALYGLDIAETLLPGEESPDYEQVEPTYYRTLENETEQRAWVKYVVRHEDRLPQEWVNSALEAAREDGVHPSLSVD